MIHSHCSTLNNRRNNEIRAQHWFGKQNWTTAQPCYSLERNGLEQTNMILISFCLAAAVLVYYSLYEQSCINSHESLFSHGQKSTPYRIAWKTELVRWTGHFRLFIFIWNIANVLALQSNKILIFNRFSIFLPNTHCNLQGHLLSSDIAV